MVSKDLDRIIKEIKIADENAIKQKEIQSFTLQDLSKINENEKTQENKIILNQDSSEKEIEQKNKIEEEPKNEINIGKEEKDEKEEEPKEHQVSKKKKKHNKKKSKKNKIFEIPQTNPYKSLIDFTEITNSRFQDNSILRLINNWEEKDWSQTTPPTKDIDEQFPNQMFPQGEIQPYLK